MYCDPSAPQARTADAAPKRPHVRSVGRPPADKCVPRAATRPAARM